MSDEHPDNGTEDKASDTLERLAALAGQLPCTPKKAGTREVMHQTWQATVTRTKAARAGQTPPAPSPSPVDPPILPDPPRLMAFWVKCALGALALAALAALVVWIKRH